MAYEARTEAAPRTPERGAEVADADRSEGAKVAEGDRSGGAAGAERDRSGEAAVFEASDPAVEASMAIFELIMAERPPRFPRVANEFGLAPHGLKAMQMLEPGTELPMGALADGLFCDASNVTGIVDRLEQRGLIERRVDASDRRVKRIALTPDGERLRAQMMEKLYEPPAGLRRLSVEEQLQLRDLLRKALEEG